MSGLHGWKLWALVMVAVIAATCAPLLAQNNYQVQIMFQIALFAGLGLAWNLVGGYAGQLSLGHVAFFGVGSYGFALLTRLSVPNWVAVFLAAIAATTLAVIIGVIVFRLRGPYFTLATIAVAEVLRLTARNLDFTGGATGLDTPALFHGRTFWKMFYFAVMGLAVVAFLVNLWVARSRFGYRLMAIREDEDTASAVGIDPARKKLQALLISAFLTGVGGALYASAFQYIVPDDVLHIDRSVQMAIIAMLGGAGTLVGPILGAVLLISASELFKNQFHEAQLLIYGILIVAVVLFLPEGIVGGIKQLWNWLRKKKKPMALEAASG